MDKQRKQDLINTAVASFPHADRMGGEWTGDPEAWLGQVFRSTRDDVEAYRADEADEADIILTDNEAEAVAMIATAWALLRSACRLVGDDDLEMETM